MAVLEGAGVVALEDGAEFVRISICYTKDEWEKQTPKLTALDKVVVGVLDG
jgi:hypothetical protein